MLRRILTILAYLAIAILIVVGTIVLVAIGRGYSYDFKTGRFTLNGLVIFSSTPSGATVRMNSKDTNRRTPYRTTLEAGQYDFEVVRDGYRSWHKRLTITASEVTWAQYVFLFPNEIKPEPVADKAVVTQYAVNKDHTRLAYITTGSEPGLWLLNFNNRRSTKIYSPKTDVPEQLVSVTWSEDASHLLVRAQQAERPIYYVIATNGRNEVTSISELFKFDFTNLQFNPANWRQLYWISPEGLRRLDLSSQTVSAVLAPGVLTYTFGADRVFYIQITDIGKTLWSLDASGQKQQIAEALAESDSYELAFSSYQNEDMLAVIPHKTRTLTLYRDIFSPHPTARVISKTVDRLQFNNDGRFLAFYSADSLGTYDLEKTKLARFRLPREPISIVSWFDNYHLFYHSAGRLKVVEFDGGNVTEVSDSHSDLPASLVSDQRYVFFAKPITGGSQLYLTEVKK